MFDIAWKVLLVAVTVAFLGAWGIIKQQRKSQELLTQLFTKAENKIIKSFKDKEVLTIKEIEKIVEGTKASLFWSKEKVQVVDPKIVAKDLIDNMKNRGIIIEEVNKGRKLFRSK